MNFISPELFLFDLTEFLAVLIVCGVVQVRDRAEQAEQELCKLSGAYLLALIL